MTSDTALPVELKKRIATAIFDPGATEGYKGERTLTEWQTDAVMRALSATRTAVKPLEWVDATKGPGCPIRFQAWPLLGYRIFLYQWGEADQWACQFGNGTGALLPNRGSADDAKSFVEAEYVRRILSALSTPEGE